MGLYKSVRKRRFCQDVIPNHIWMRYHNTNKTATFPMTLLVVHLSHLQKVWKDSGTLSFRWTLIHFLPAVLFLKECTWICNKRAEAQIYSFPSGKASPLQHKLIPVCMHAYLLTPVSHSPSVVPHCSRSKFHDSQGFVFSIASPVLQLHVIHK